ncbi:MAG: hypothetical protein KZQ93_10045 [Candidatus Thiodiazotropha sp. (ex Monitilora ramsayi)]|nr:hypothetical protein [Candidatus Thiodiazotropha sp. (ex Monitilora ramsayi)]
MELISTTYKEKLPKGKSFPIGAEALSQHLVEAPQYGELSIAFSAQDEYWASKYNKKVKAGGDIKVLVVDYSQVFEEWSIKVNAVPCDHKHTVNELLVLKALPRLLKALKANASGECFKFQATYNLTNKGMSCSS